MALPVRSNWDDEEWEICNDNGFVYKRRRRRSTDDEDFPPPPRSPDANPEADLSRHRRTRKKRCLLTLKEKYQKELEQWENLSSAIAHLTTIPPPSSDPPPLLSPPQLEQPLIEELLLQVECQESVLGKLRELCDYVDSVCDAEEERLVKSLIELPVWESPKTLIASLSSQ